MIYYIFATQQDLDDANERYMAKREELGICDCNRGNPVTPQITQRYSTGREMLDGRIACTIPDNVDLRGAFCQGGVEETLTDADFPVVEMEV